MTEREIVSSRMAQSPGAFMLERAAATLPALLQATLGLRFDPFTVTVHFERPRLPPFLEEVTLFNLAVGGGRVTVHLQRVGNEVALNVIERVGPIKVQLTS